MNHEICCMRNAMKFEWAMNEDLKYIKYEPWNMLYEKCNEVWTIKYEPWNMLYEKCNEVWNIKYEPWNMLYEKCNEEI